MKAQYEVASFGNLGAQVTAIIDGRRQPVGMMENSNAARRYVAQSLKERGLDVQWSDFKPDTCVSVIFSQEFEV